MLPSEADPTNEAPKRVARLIADPGAFATPLVAALVLVAGSDALQWHADAIARELEDATKVAISGVNLDRLMAGIAVMTTDRFTSDPRAFATLCRVLSGAALDEAHSPPDSVEAAWGITEATLLDPGSNNPARHYSEAVRRYLGAVLAEEGIDDPPDVLALAIPPGGRRAPADPDAGSRALRLQVAAARRHDVESALSSGLARLLDQLHQLHPEASQAIAELRSRIPQPRTP